MIDPDAVAMLTAEPTGGVVWHASRGAITLRVDGRRARGARRPGAPRGERVRAHGADRRAARALARELLARRTAIRWERRGRGSMLVVGGASGSGANFNVVPGAAWFSVDRRFNPEEDLERGARAADADDRRRRRRIGADVERRRAAAAAVRRAPTAQHPAALALGALRQRPSRARRRASSCARACSRRAGTRSSAFPRSPTAPGGSTSPTARDEYIDEAAMRRCAAVYALFAASALAPGGSRRGGKTSPMAASARKTSGCVAGAHLACARSRTPTGVKSSG